MATKLELPEDLARTQTVVRPAWRCFKVAMRASVDPRRFCSSPKGCSWKRAWSWAGLRGQVAS